MTGTKLYPKKGRMYFFLIMYAILAVAGGVLASQSISRNQGPAAAAGFMIMFGIGMFVMTLSKARKPQVSVYEDYLQLNQSRKPELVRYRNIVSVSQPDANRLVVTLREDKSRKQITIWVREFEKTDVERLAAFLSGKVSTPR